MKIAIIGYGNWGKKLEKEYIQILGADNVLIHDPPQEKVIRDWDEIVGVHIATPPLSHFRLAKKYLKMGKNVLLEKPMCLSSKDCIKLIDITRKSRRILMIGHIFRYSDALKKITKKPKKHIKFIWKHSSKAINVFWDLLPHIFDICNYLTGDEWPRNLRGVYNKRNAFVIGYLGAVPLFIELSLDYNGKIRSLIIDNEEFQLLKMQTNNTIRDEAKEFINRINLKTGHQSTDGFLGYMTVKLIEEIKRETIYEKN